MHDVIAEVGDIMKVEMPHPDNPLVCMGKLYEPYSWQAKWYRNRYDYFVNLIATRKAEMPFPDTSPMLIGSDSRFYLSAEESNSFAEAGQQVDYVERILARERVENKRKARREKFDKR